MKRSVGGSQLKEQLRDQPGEEHVAPAEEEEQEDLIGEVQELGSEEVELQPQTPVRERRQPDRLQMSPQTRKKKKAQAKQKPKTKNPPSGIWFRGARWIPPVKRGGGTRGGGVWDILYFCEKEFFFLCRRSQKAKKQKSQVLHFSLLLFLN